MSEDETFYGAFGTGDNGLRIVDGDSPYSSSFISNKALATEDSEISLDEKLTRRFGDIVFDYFCNAMEDAGLSFKEELVSGSYGVMLDLGHGSNIILRRYIDGDKPFSGFIKYTPAFALHGPSWEVPKTVFLEEPGQSLLANSSLEEKCFCGSMDERFPDLKAFVNFVIQAEKQMREVYRL
jgi:hypothetical protein